jgi:hypothetical protein
MRTKMLLLVGLLIVSFGAKSSTHNELQSEECMKNAVQCSVESEFPGWDFSRVKEWESRATVVFKVGKDGEVAVEDMAADDETFGEIVKKNMNQMKIESNCIDHSKTFVITLKHRRQ